MPEAASRGSLTRRLAIGTALGVVAVALVAALLLRSTVGLSDSQRAVLRSEAVLREVGRAQRQVSDLETGVRSYVTTGRAAFLNPYVSALRVAPSTLDTLDRFAEGATERRYVVTVRGAVESYRREFAAPLLARDDFPVAPEDGIAIATEADQRLQGAENALAAFTDLERVRLSERTSEAEDGIEGTIVASVVALIVLIVLVITLAVLGHRTVVLPLRRFSEAVGRMRRGDLDISLDRRGPSEIAELGDAIEELAGTLATSRERLEESTAELRRLSDRNLLLLDNVFAQTPAGLAFLDRGLRFVRVNAALAAMTGRPVEAHLGHTLEEVVPALAPHAVPLMERVVATGETIADRETSGETAAEPGTTRSWTVTYFPVREEGAVVGLGIVVLDVTARRRAEEEREVAYAAERRAREAAETARARAAFLADAGAALDVSLDLDETIAAVARLCVGRIADWCSFDLAVTGERIRNAAVAHTDPAKVELAAVLQERYPPDPASPTGAPAVIRTGRPELYPEIPADLLRASAFDDEHFDLLAGLGMVSAMVVPLAARDTTFGAITLVSAESGRRFDEDDLALAQELATRSSLALENARLYRERSHVAQTLQASLLPEALPVIPGVALAARYEPLGEMTEVGGDFYDVFATEEGRWAVIIGDVCGKGAEAAALTALARYTLRAVAPLPPAEALRHLNAAILRQRNDLRFITLIYAELDLRGARPVLRLASGGHPPALLVRAVGPGEVLTCPGTLIGVTPDPQLGECEAVLEPGDTVALYTDGVTESSHEEPLDAEAILARLAHDRSADGVADRLQRLARSDGSGPARDDVAILALQVS